MDEKYLVTLRSADDAGRVRASGCEVLAEYPSMLLVRATNAQVNRLRQDGLEVSALPAPSVQVTGANFAFSDAMAADAAAPVVSDPNRRAHYLIALIGPPQAEWLATLKAHGGIVRGELSGFVLLVGLLPAEAEALKAESWVENITPFRAAMKISPKLRPGVGRRLGVGELATVDLDGHAAERREQVQISVFPGEGIAAVAARVRASGGLILSESQGAITALVEPRVIAEVANEPEVQAVVPYSFPELHNDRARVILAQPAGDTFGGLTNRGANEIVGIGDSGLDTGNAAAIHADFAGRIAGLTSLPVDFPPDLAPYINGPLITNDGAADTNSAHGTHVAGSVLGNGAAAGAAGSAVVPRGVAPDARVFLQAVEQEVDWKPVAQLNAEGIPVPPGSWPPPRFGLYGLPADLVDLFTPAYTAGARIHTNSWGSSLSTDAGVYNDNARAVDDFMWNHRDMLILFSAGNAGRDNNNDGQVDGDSIGPPGTAKNCLTVGASENNRPMGTPPPGQFNTTWNNFPVGNPRYPNIPAGAGHISDNPDGMAAFSSRGPTDDGRIKPEVVAPGTNILSTRSSAWAGAAPTGPLWGDVSAPDVLHGLYCFSGGTSMSTPLVAGCAALVRHHLVAQRGHVAPGSKPSGALIKAILINGATALPGQYAGEIPAASPLRNSVAGFGRVNLLESLAPGALARTLFADDPDHAVGTGEMRTFEAHAVDLTRPLKVTLAWTDAPATAGLGGLTNRLYLQVRDPGGTILDGDATAFPTVSNNVQQIIIAAPVAGAYEIRVRGVSVTVAMPGAGPAATPRQDFALAVSNAMGLSTQPVSVAQAIDTTGSMLAFGYIEPAKERAAQLVDFMRANDKVSVTEFSQRPALPLARTVYPLRLLTAFDPDWTDANAAIGGLVADGFTPIGAGLLEAWNQIDLEPAGRPRAIVLLSDGLNNVPPDPLSAVAGIPADVPIFTVALGPAGSTPTLNAIAASRPNGAYFEVAGDEDVHKLHEIYAQVQALAAGATVLGLQSAEIASNSEAAVEVPVEGSVEEVAFTVSWDASGREMELVAIAPDGTQVDVAGPAAVERRGQTWQIVRVAAPLPGTWKVVARNGGSQAPVRTTLSAAAQSRLALTAEVHPAGVDRLSILARLRYRDEPWDQAEVVARVTMPTRSRAQVLEKFGDRIRAVQLPDGVDEPGLDDEARLNLKIAVFAQQQGPADGGLFGRTTVEVPLVPQGHGLWSSEAPLSAPGTATVEIVARGEIDGQAWQRYATLAANVPEKEGVPPAGAALRVDDIQVGRRNGYVFVTARVADESDVATPEEGTQVRLRVSVGGRERDLGMQFLSRSQRYQARSKLPRGTVHLTVRADQNGVHAEREQDAQV